MGCAVQRGGYGHGGGNVWRTAVAAVAVCIILVVPCAIGRIAEPALAGEIRFRVVNLFGIRLPFKHGACVFAKGLPPNLRGILTRASLQ